MALTRLVVAIALTGVGAGLAVVGTAMIYEPAAFILCGVLFAALGLLGVRIDSERR